MNTLIPPPLLVLLAGALMYLVEAYARFGKFEFALAVPLALLLLIAGLLLMLVAAASFLKAKTTINPLRPARASSLVSTGIFSLSRNPIYLGDLLLLAAWLLWLGNWLNLAVLVLFVCYLNRFQIGPEERALSQLFGDDYRAYCARVRRWI